MLLFSTREKKVIERVPFHLDATMERKRYGSVKRYNNRHDWNMYQGAEKVIEDRLAELDVERQKEVAKVQAELSACVGADQTERARDLTKRKKALDKGNFKPLHEFLLRISPYLDLIRIKPETESAKEAAKRAAETISAETAISRQAGSGDGQPQPLHNLQGPRYTYHAWPSTKDSNIMDFVYVKPRPQAKLRTPKYNEFLHEMATADGNPDAPFHPDDHKRKQYLCANCGDTTFKEDNVFLVCVTCGNCTKNETFVQSIQDKDRVTFKSKQQPYKPLGHFIDCLQQLQAKESVVIPDTIYQRLEQEFTKLGVARHTVTEPFIQKCLKKLRLQKYYNHVPLITYKFTNIPPFRLSSEQEELLAEMFVAIQPVYARHKERGRKNFVNYCYLTMQMYQLIGIGDQFPKHKQLKSKMKLSQYDKVWKKICGELGWAYHKSL